MKTRRRLRRTHRRRRMVVSNRRRHRVRRALRRAHHRGMFRKNPARRRRRHHRRRYRFEVGHVVRRIRTNPPGGKAMSEIGGVVAGNLAFSVVNGLIVSKMVTGSTSTSSAGTRTAVSMGISAALGFGGYYVLRKKMPNVALGIGAAAAVAVVMEGLLAAGITALGATAAATQTAAAQVQQNQTGQNTGGTAGTGGTGGQFANAGTGFGTGSTGTAAYLGANRRRRRRVAAYLGNMRRRKMGLAQYLQPGKPIQSLIGITPTRATFGRNAGGLNGLYTAGGVFGADAWSRGR